MSERIPPVKKGQIIDNVLITETGKQGDGVARINGNFVLFVLDSKAGENVTVRIKHVLQSYAVGEKLPCPMQ